MNEKIELGKINMLRVERMTAHGAFLSSKDKEEVLLPNRYTTKSMKEGDVLAVFVMSDSEDRLVALGERPTALVDEFGFFEVVGVESFGAFVDWGVPKDLFVPKNNQKSPFRVGDKRIIRVVYDGSTDRLIGDERVGRYLTGDVRSLREKEEAEVLVLAKTPLGYKLIVNNAFEGMAYHNEIFEKIEIGEVKKGFIKKIREDGKLDISLTKIGEQRKDDAAKKVLQTLQKNGGKAPFTYKSDAEDIKRMFGLSKKTYKAALTTLIEAKEIELLEDGIRAL